MGTRGLVGIRNHGVLKAMYNHSDSYPEGLGIEVLDQLREGAITAKAKKAFDQIIMVDDRGPVPRNMITRYAPYMNESVSSGRAGKPSWYQMLRGLQGQIRPYLDGEVQHMLDGSDFINDALFCEWAYIVDLDTNTLDVIRSGDPVLSYPLRRLPTTAEFLDDVERLEEDY